MMDRTPNLAVAGQIGLILSTHTEVIELILKNLKNKDLISASLVCKNWNSVVNSIKKNRTILECNRYKCTSVSDLDKNIFKKLINSEYLPNFCISFIKYDLYNRYAEILLQKLEPMYEKSVVHSQLKKSLPINCKSFLLPCMKFPTDRIENENDILNITFPNLKGILVEQYELDSSLNEKQLMSQLNNENIKCIIMFTYSCKAKSIMENILIKLRIKNKSIIIGAFMLSNFVLQDGRHGYDFLKILTFSGDNLQMKSVVIPQESYTNEEIEKHVLKLQEQKFKPHRSIAFMFAERQRRCSGVDVQIFGHYFPDTPIVGLDVEDVLKLSDEPAKSNQLLSLIPRWQITAIPEGVRVCYTRFSGPSQIILMSW